MIISQPATRKFAFLIITGVLLLCSLYLFNPFFTRDGISNEGWTTSILTFFVAFITAVLAGVYFKVSKEIAFILFASIIVFTEINLALFRDSLVYSPVTKQKVEIYLYQVVNKYLLSRCMLWLVIMPPLVYLLRQKAAPHRVLSILIPVLFIVGNILAILFVPSPVYFFPWIILVLLGVACCWDEIAEWHAKLNANLIWIFLIVIFLARGAQMLYPVYSMITE